MRRSWKGLSLLAALLLPAAITAADGVLEINEACALNSGCFEGDGAGWPVTISAPGSYRLTGNLAVTSGDETAISITSEDVDLDLAGFEILGPQLAGTGAGVSSTSSDVTVRGGTIRGLGGDGVALGARARVEGVTSLFNGNTGMTVGARSLVRDCQVAGNESYGLFLGDATGWSGNVLSDNNGRDTAPQVAAASATALPVEMGVNICGASATCSLAAPKRVFVTSQVVDGMFGGLEGGDSICNSQASAAGLSGTYRAWLGDGSAGPSVRFAQSPRPYVRSDGTVIANDWADLTDGTLAAPIDRNEFGESTSGAVWTSVDVNGVAEGANHCSGWNSISGNGRQGLTTATSGAWTQDSTGFCMGAARLYCFEQ